MRRDTGISRFDLVVLSTLSMAAERTLRMSEVAHHAGSTLSRLSTVVSLLEARGWVRRRPDPADGRYTRATLSDEGQNKVTAAAPTRIDKVRRLVLDPLTKAQQSHLGAASQRILDALRPRAGLCAVAEVLTTLDETTLVPQAKRLQRLADEAEAHRDEVVGETHRLSVSLTDPSAPYGILVIEATRLMEEFRYTSEVLLEAAKDAG